MDNIESYVQRFSPLMDSHGCAIEATTEYVRRMQAGPLPDWPDEVLAEWFRRHHECLWKYARLGYEQFHFRKELWDVERVPRHEAFDDDWNTDNYTNVESRAENPNDWLPRFMLENGTWNTPIILLENIDDRCAVEFARTLNSPYHLLEGHRRLSFLIGLRDQNLAAAEHYVWLVTIPESA